MSSWKRAAKANQKTHRERHQPESRAHLGLLEKKKDYVARAKDYHEKQSTIKLLRRRALNKNPDEFYFHMINAKLDNGVHREKEKDEEHTPDQIKLMETQDIKYISYKRNVEAKKIDKLQSQLHMIDAANETKNKHTFFADDKRGVKSFDLAEHLDTHSSLLGRRTNRPRLSKLKEMKLPAIDDRLLAKMEQQKHMAYKELHKRVDRERELTIIQQKLEMKRALQDKTVPKPKRIKSATADAPPIYQWKFQRKR
ncbi:probable U3 small nucleolar RNA-associated protein 11 [Athalia rosae]|uniref:probable U3 small nucleolar RNA-associated protein 11 n=1 Tax=Athalia rosae TaxID=37344 RepID=UPI00203441D4|nr:probable U3 small nucleolar RNA-associated protein 11 [Athalia rosae]XP_020709598.2 probable U3 small nucleolar RNA-associated protein 11 [Athalia rosae]